MSDDGTRQLLVQAPPHPPPHPDQHYDSEEEGMDMSFASEQIMSIVKPIVLCLVLTIILVRTIQMGQDNSQQRWSGLAYNEDENADASAGEKLGGALLNALILVVLIVVMTTVFVLLYKYRCMKVIYGWLMMSSTMMLGAVGAFVLLKLLMVYNAPLDLFSFLFVLWNFAAVGLASIFWRSPLLLQQAYLIISSSFLATMFYALLPVWTSWVVLAAVAVYDICAVLCPKGPLRVLVETASERPDQPLPGLLYSAGMAYSVALADVDERTRSKPKSKSKSKPVKIINEDGTQTVAKYRYEYEYEYDDDGRDGNGRGSGSDGDNSADPASAPLPPPRLDSELGGSDGDPASATLLQPFDAGNGSDGSGAPGEYASPLDRSSGRGLKLGMGDFCFYGVLVSHAAVADMISMFTTSVAILMGLIMTLFCLGIYKKALPALPFSIALGMLFYFSTELVLTPYFITLSMSGVYV